MSSPSLRRVLAGARFTCLLCPLTASAQVEPAADGAFQLQLQLGLWDYARISSQAEGVVAGGTDVTSTASQAGAAARAGIGLGYGLNELLQLHLLVGFSVRQSRAWLVDDQENRSDASSFAIEVLPSLRYLLGKGERRPYLGAALGYIFESARTDLNDNEASSKSLAAGLVGGMYRRVGSHFSVDPGLEIYYLRNRGEGGARYEDGDTFAATSGHGFRVLLTLGVSGWFGAQAPPP